jgi:tRNA pseudouridine55 synthase
MSRHLQRGAADFAAGEVILIDKPLHWTSFDVVAKLRNTLKVKKIGHAGTLDPLATGLLILCTGAKTKQIQFIQDAPKQYLAEFTLGATTASYDAETPPENPRDANHLTAEDVQRVLPEFTGEVQQLPPAYSAVKVQGTRAYELARQGQQPELKARTVSITSLELISFEGPDKVLISVHCSKGTYIRSLVHDIGQRLGVGAYLTGLVRTQIGDYRLADAVSVPEFVATFGPQSA